MTKLPRQKTHRARSWHYLLRVLLSFVGLVLLLDIAWSLFNTNNFHTNAEHYWQDAFISSVKTTVEQNPLIDHAALAEQLHEELGIGILIDPLDNIELDTMDWLDDRPTLIDINGESFLLSVIPESAVQIRVGPLPKEQHEWLSSLITLGFYTLVALLIWLWIRPVINGLDQLSQATERFAKNYREPLPAMKLRSPVKELSESIESMADDIRTLVQTQAELTGGLSHELRTPLARVKFALATAKNQLGDTEQFDSIEQDVEELEQLVEAMLDYSRLQQTQAALQWESMDAKEVFEKLTEKYRWRTGADISVECTEHSAIYADSRLMPLAISNLLVNATRYAKNIIQLDFESNNESQRICIADDGPGIPEEKRQQALQPFKKNACSESPSDGFGLGLAIVNRIALLHGGRIELDESELGGLKVDITWPIQLSVKTPEESAN